MPPRLPTSLVAASSRCTSFFTAPFAPRAAVASLHSTARLAVPRQNPPSSGASFLNLDSEGRRPEGRRPGNSSPHAPSRQHGWPPRSNDANTALSSVLFDSEARQLMFERREDRKRSALDRMMERKVTDDYTKQMARRWKQGDLYTPNDLSPYEAGKWKKPYTKKHDIVDILGINPIDEYRNFTMLGNYTTEMGRIRHSKDTGLRAVNQRRMAKAIRRAVGMGILPSTHRHPEILAPSFRRSTAMNSLDPYSSETNRKE